MNPSTPRPHAFRRHSKGTACTVCGNSQAHPSHGTALPNFKLSSPPAPAPKAPEPVPPANDDWGSRATDAEDRNFGRSCLVCGKPVRAGERMMHFHGSDKSITTPAIEPASAQTSRTVQQVMPVTQTIIKGLASFQRGTYRTLQMVLLEQHDRLGPLRQSVQDAEDKNDVEAWRQAYFDLRTAEDANLAALAAFLGPDEPETEVPT